MTLERLEDNARIVWGNLMEAKSYSNRALEAKSEERAEASWYAEMAKRHLEFNNQGLLLVDRMAEELAQSCPEKGPGVLAMHRYRRADWAKETAQIQAMLSTMGK